MTTVDRRNAFSAPHSPIVTAKLPTIHTLASAGAGERAKAPMYRLGVTANATPQATSLVRRELVGHAGATRSARSRRAIRSRSWRLNHTASACASSDGPTNIASSSDTWEARELGSPAITESTANSTAQRALQSEA